MIIKRDKYLNKLISMMNKDFIKVVTGIRRSGKSFLLFVAQKLKETETISMRVNPVDYPATDCDIFGFVFPLYNWTMPEPKYAKI